MSPLELAGSYVFILWASSWLARVCWFLYCWTDPHPAILGNTCKLPYWQTVQQLGRNWDSQAYDRIWHRQRVELFCLGKARGWAEPACQECAGGNAHRR